MISRKSRCILPYFLGSEEDLRKIKKEVSMPIGIPRTDVERMSRHYGVDLEAAKKMLESGVPLPERGTGLKTGRADSREEDDGEFKILW